MAADRAAQIGGEDERQERGLGEESRFRRRVDIAKTIEAAAQVRVAAGIVSDGDAGTVGLAADEINSSPSPLDRNAMSL